MNVKPFTDRGKTCNAAKAVCRVACFERKQRIKEPRIAPLANGAVRLPYETYSAKEDRSDSGLSRKSSRLFRKRYTGDYSML